MHTQHLENEGKAMSRRKAQPILAGILLFCGIFLLAGLWVDGDRACLSHLLADSDPSAKTDPAYPDRSGVGALEHLGALPCIQILLLHDEQICVDNDGDGYGSPASGLCMNPTWDCDDSDPDIYTGAVEVCDNADNNCDEQIDEQPAASASCSNSLFCDGQETCDSGSCWPGANPCGDDNACTDDVCIEGNDSCENACRATGFDDPCCEDPACAAEDLCEWPGGEFQFQLTEIQQEAPGCFIGQSLLDFILINLGLGSTVFPVFLPAEDDYPDTLYLDIPFLGIIEIDAYFVGNQIEFNPPVTIADIDIIAIIQELDPSGVLEFTARLLGLNCVIGGTADGYIDGLSEDHVDLTLEVDQLTSIQGSGWGLCLLTPSEDCILRALAGGSLL